MLHKTQDGNTLLFSVPVIWTQLPKMNGAFKLLSPRRKIQEKMLLTLCFAVFHFPVQENMQIAFLWMLCHILVKVLWGSMHLAELSLVPAWRVGLFLLIETDFVIRDTQVQCCLHSSESLVTEISLALGAIQWKHTHTHRHREFDCGVGKKYMSQIWPVEINTGNFMSKNYMKSTHEGRKKGKKNPRITVQQTTFPIQSVFSRLFV